MARDLKSVVRSDPFRFAFGLSLLLHVGLFVLVRWKPLDFGPDKRIITLHLRFLEQEPEEAAPAVAAAPPAPIEPAAPVAPQPREPERSAGAGLPASALLPAPEPTGWQPAPQPDEPAPERTPERALELAREPAAEPAAEPVVAAAGDAAPQALDSSGLPVETAPAGAGTRELPHKVPDGGVSLLVVDMQPSRTGETGSGSGPAGAPEGSAPQAAASGLTGMVSANSGDGGNALPGVPAAALAASAPAPTAVSGRGGPALHELAAVRRRIDARKVYPQIAVRNGWEGRVLVEMHLEGDGSLATVRLLERSGYAVLDEATISAVRRASPFPPVARILTVPVEYRLVP